MNWKIAFRSLMKKKVLFIIMSVLVFIAACLFSLNQFMFGTIYNNFDKVQAGANVEDFRIYENNQLSDYYTDQMYQQIANEYNLTMQETTYYRLKEDSMNYSVYPIMGDEQINIPYLYEGELASNSGEINIVPGYLEEINAEIGDELEIAGNRYKIVGTIYPQDQNIPVEVMDQNATHKDYSSYTPIYMTNNDITMIANGNESVTFVSAIYNERLDSGTEKSGNDVRDNYFAFSSFDGSSEVDFSDDAMMIEEADLADYTNMILTEISDQYLTADGYSLFQDNIVAYTNYNIYGSELAIRSQSMIISVCMTILVMMSWLMIGILVSNVLRSNRREIGILKAMGYLRKQINRSFLIVIAGILLLLAGMGILAGFLLSKAYISNFAHSYETLLDLNIGNSYSQIIIYIVGLTIVSLLIAYFFSIRRNTKDQALVMVKNIKRERPPKVNISFLTKRLKFTSKYQLNLIVRNLSKTVLLFVGVLISGFLFFLCGAVGEVVIQMTSGQYDQGYEYSYKVNSSSFDLYDEDGMSALESPVILESINGNTRLDSVIEEETVMLVAYKYGENDAITVTNSDGSPLTASEGVAINEDYAEKQNINVGDQLTFVSNLGEEEITLPVTTLTSNTLFPTIFVDLDYLQSVLNIGDSVNTRYFHDDYTQKVADEILKQDPNAVISPLQSVEEDAKAGMFSLLSQLAVIFFFGLIISFLTIFSVTSIIVDSNLKIISIMKVMGYCDKEIKKMVLSAYKWVVIFGYGFLMAVLSYTLDNTGSVTQQDGELMIPASLDYRIAIIGFVVLLAIYFASIAISYQQIKKVTPADSLKIDE